MRILSTSLADAPHLLLSEWAGEEKCDDLSIPSSNLADAPFDVKFSFSVLASRFSKPIRAGDENSHKNETALDKDLPFFFLMMYFPDTQQLAA